ncbi:MAG: siphovirus Gp157 family protein [Acidaminococcaceae bacterium]|nr:siphovirus Gp157 family protein [Acidaminococcaceae bacterium]MBR6817907.1 siphovirus Gp157 family protein [Acidaminococcaceae bacterium]
MNLFEINDAITRCVKLADGENYVDTETGEIIDTAAIEQLEMDRDTKIRNIACWIRNLESDEEQLAEQETIYKNRKNATKRKKEQLKSYLAAFLNGEKWKNKEVEILWRKSKSVEVTDIKKLSSYYLRYKEPEVNKKLLGNDLKAGIKLDGAALVEKNNMKVN